jgi:hypothetical protein
VLGYRESNDRRKVSADRPIPPAWEETLLTRMHGFPFEKPGIADWSQRRIARAMADSNHRFRAAGPEPNLRPFGHDLAAAHAPSHWSPRRWSHANSMMLLFGGLNDPVKRTSKRDQPSAERDDVHEATLFLPFVRPAREAG